MGTFATLFQKAGDDIPDDRKEEFKNRIEKLFQAGGMMELKRVQLCNKEVLTMEQASMHNYGMDFYYNYFEDSPWENAGFNSKSGHVWSNKIGWQHFHHVVIAAYVLESIYLNGPAVAMVNGDLVTSQMYTGWINYLFHEHYPRKNNDPWKLFETFHDEFNTDLKEYEWGEFVKDIYGAMGYYEIRSVLFGTDIAIKEFESILSEDEEDGKMSFLAIVTKLKKAAIKYHEESSRGEKEQLSLLMDILYIFYEQKHISFDSIKEYGDENLDRLMFFIVLSNVPAYVINVLAEIYEIDFWELWKQVRDVAKREPHFGGEMAVEEVASVATTDFLCIEPDDMILFWEPNGDIEFSKNLWEWFVSLKRQFDEIVKMEIISEKPLEWILGLMEYADENYYRIYTFSSFFEETMEHLNDKRFQVLWKIYDAMLHDQEMEEAGSVIFVPDGSEYENMGLNYIGTQPRRRLKGYWDVMKVKEKNNKARITFRRYMALMENRKLREKVFGF